MVIKTVIVVIPGCWFAEDGMNLFISACRTCSTLISLHMTNQILNLCGVVVAVPSSMLKLPNHALDSIAHKHTTNK